MLHQDSIEGKRKPRGRPFVKGNKKGKPPCEILDDLRHETCNERGNIALEQENSTFPPKNDFNDQKIDGLAIGTVLNKIQKSKIPEPPYEKELDFFRGEHKITIKFYRCPQRRYHLKIFLNDTIEIRPYTYSGGKAGRLFWEFLKNSLGE